MNKEFEKNRLDLAYQRQLTFLNAILTLFTIGILSFLGTFIWNPDYLFYGFLIIIMFSFISYLFYRRIDKNLKEISNKIKSL